MMRFIWLMRLMILLPLLAVLLILPPIVSVNAKKVEDNTPSGLGFIPKSTHCEGLEGTAKGGVNYDDGYDQGYVDAHRHFVGKSGHANAPDDTG